MFKPLKPLPILKALEIGPFLPLPPSSSPFLHFLFFSSHWREFFFFKIPSSGKYFFPSSGMNFSSHWREFYFYPTGGKKSFPLRGIPHIRELFGVKSLYVIFKESQDRFRASCNQHCNPIVTHIASLLVVYFFDCTLFLIVCFTTVLRRI